MRKDLVASSGPVACALPAGDIHLRGSDGREDRDRLAEAIAAAEPRAGRGTWPRRGAHRRAQGLDAVGRKEAADRPRSVRALAPRGPWRPRERPDRRPAAMRWRASPGLGSGPG